MPNPVVHFEVQARDAGKIQEFYQKLFDWHVNADNPMNYGIVDTHAEGGIGGGIGPAMDGVNRVTFYAQVDDLQKYLDKAEELGGKTIMPPTEIPDMVTLAMFTDPEGNVIGMVKEM
jgi:hypothetical protein